jgi:hypothetical protein
MMMSVYAEGKATRQIDHLICIRLAVDAESVAMITFAALHSKPVLVGIEGATTIVKPLENGDDALSFLALYDDSISSDDFRKMERAGVNSREAIPPAIYQAVIHFQVNATPKVCVRVKARNEAAARSALRDLFEDDIFLAQVTMAIAKKLSEFTDVEAVTSGGLRIEDVAPPDAPDWAIVEPGEDD